MALIMKILIEDQFVGTTAQSTIDLTISVKETTHITTCTYV